MVDSFPKTCSSKYIVFCGKKGGHTGLEWGWVNDEIKYLVNYPYNIWQLSMAINWHLLSEYRRRSYAAGLWICIWLVAEELVIICASPSVFTPSSPRSIKQQSHYQFIRHVTCRLSIMLYNSTVTPWIYTWHSNTYNRTYRRVTCPRARICNNQLYTP